MLDQTHSGTCVPAFAMTAHKAQGKTMEAVILDLESTSGTEAPYVMLSRATSLGGVYILRHFQRKVIQGHPSQDVREEFRRLDMLTHQTIMLHGTADEASEAQKYLVDTFSPHALPHPNNEGEEDAVPDEARRLEALQKATSRLMAGAPPRSDPRQVQASSPRWRRVLRTSMMPVDNDSVSLDKKRPSPDSEPHTPNKRRRPV